MCQFHGFTHTTSATHPLTVFLSAGASEIHQTLPDWQTSPAVYRTIGKIRSITTPCCILHTLIMEINTQAAVIALWPSTAHPEQWAELIKVKSSLHITVVHLLNENVLFQTCVLYTEFYLLLSNFLNSLASACLIGIGFSKSSANNRWKMKVEHAGT